MSKKYFLAANSCSGFISFFEDAYSVNDGWRAYIIKGGPGTGKSSFMKKLANHGAELGLTPIFCPCSSDPDSLDAIIFEENKILIFDGTPPHAVEPKNLGICETIVDLGEFLNSSSILPNKSQILAAAKENSKYHKTASLYLKTAKELILKEIERQKALINNGKLESYCQKFCKQLFKTKRTAGGETTRLITGITPKGIVTFNEGLEYKNIFVIKDETGATANEYFTVIKANAKTHGYSVVNIANPFLPNILLDGIILPELDTVIIRECRYITPKTYTKRINSKRFTFDYLETDNTANFNKRLIKELITEAISNLKYAKSAHDQLEKFYIDAMDFKALNRFYENFKTKIF